MTESSDPPAPARGTNFEIRPIEARETLVLRRAILRPTTADDDLVFESDYTPGALHVGAFAEGELVGIASVHQEDWFDDRTGGWRLRGMATVERVRRRGVGRWMLATCMQHAYEQGGTHIWCNARTPAVAFYESMGFALVGEEFEIPGAGPHFVMWRDLRP